MPYLPQTLIYSPFVGKSLEITDSPGRDRGPVQQELVKTDEKQPVGDNDYSFFLSLVDDDSLRCLVGDRKD